MKERGEEENRRILEVYQRLVAQFRKALGVDEMQALDLAHEVVVKLYEAMPRFDPSKGEFDAWASGFVKNLAWQRREGRGSHVPLGDRDLDGDQTQALAGLVRGEIGRYIRSSLEALPEIYRTTLEMHFVKRQKLREIATALKVPVGTVKARLSRGLEMLKGRLNFQHTTVRMYLK